MLTQNVLTGTDYTCCYNNSSLRGFHTICAVVNQFVHCQKVRAVEKKDILQNDNQSNLS